MPSAARGAFGILRKLNDTHPDPENQIEEVTDSAKQDVLGIAQRDKDLLMNSTSGFKVWDQMRQRAAEPHACR